MALTPHLESVTTFRSNSFRGKLPGVITSSLKLSLFFEAEVVLIFPVDFV